MNALKELRDGWNKLGELLTAVEGQTTPRIHQIPARIIELREGEFYIGAILKEDGTHDYDLVGLDEGLEKGTWDHGMEFALKRGARMGDRRDHALARTNARHKYKDEWHWTDEQLVSHSVYAWAQDFSNGRQGYSRKDDQFRVRLFRRVY